MKTANFGQSSGHDRSAEQKSCLLLSKECRMVIVESPNKAVCVNGVVRIRTLRVLHDP